MRRQEMRFADYQKRLYGYALALTRDPEHASDLVQDCAVRAIGAKQIPLDEAPYRAWLFTIIRNLWLDHVRRSQIGGRIDPIDDQDLAHAGPIVEDVVINTIAVRQAFERLLPEQRDILALIDIAGFGYKEAGALLDLPIGTVMSRVSRARMALCRLLSDVAATTLPTDRRKSST